MVSPAGVSQSLRQRPPAEPLGRPFKSLAEYDREYTPLGEELGRGASGVVKRATRRRDGLGVAVKSIDLRALRVMGGPGFSISRLRREVDVMLGLRHPNIVELYGAYGDADSVRLVMELVEGEELFDAILSRGKFEEGEAKPLFGSLCAAVAYMHSRGVIHRDLKPENVLIDSSPKSNKGVKLVDFGLSKLVASNRGGSAARTMVGTPSYLAPEIEEMRHFSTKQNTTTRQALRHQREVVEDFESDDDENVSVKEMSLRSEDEVSLETPNHNEDQPAYDSQVDAWSMGVTLYVMLIARFPVYRRDDEGHINGVELPREATTLSPQAQSLIVRLLDADPRRRCSVAEALKDPWLETTVAACYSPPRNALLETHYSDDDTKPAVTVGANKKKKKREMSYSVHEDLDHQQPSAALVATASLRLPDEMRRAGLVYHERALASRTLASKLRSTANLVLETLDDLALAIDAKQAEAARDILGSVRRWTSELTAECATAKTQNLESMRHLADFAQGLVEGPPSSENNRVSQQQRTTAGVLASNRRVDALTHALQSSAPDLMLVEDNLEKQMSISSPRNNRHQLESLELASDDDVLELLLPVTADDLIKGGPLGANNTKSTHDLIPVESTSVEPVLKCLGELHVIFSRMELFWSNVEVSLDTVLRRSEALETLLKFAETPKLKSRFDARLDQFRQFWASLATWHIEIVTGRTGETGLSSSPGAVAVGPTNNSTTYKRGSATSASSSSATTASAAAALGGNQQQR